MEVSDVFKLWLLLKFLSSLERLIPLYKRTKYIPHVMRLLGHKSIANTLIYTQLVESESDEYWSFANLSVCDCRPAVAL